MAEEAKNPDLPGEDDEEENESEASTISDANEARKADFTELLTDVIGLSINQSNCMEANGIKLIEHIVLLDKETLMGVFPAHSNAAIGAMQKMRLNALRTWAMEQQQQIDANRIDITQFTMERCKNIQGKLTYKTKRPCCGSGA